MLKFRFVILSFALLCIVSFALRLDNQAAAQVRRNDSSVSQSAALSPGKYSTDSLESLLESVRREYGVPALATTVVRSDGSIVSAATGVRIQKVREHGSQLRISSASAR